MKFNIRLVKYISVLLTAVFIFQCPVNTLAQEEKPSSFLDSITSGFDDALEWSQNAVNDIQEWSNNVVDDVQAWAITAFSDVQTWTQTTADDATKWTQGAAANAWNWTQTAANNAWDWTQGAAVDAWGWTQTAANDAVEWTCTTATDVWNVTTESISGTWTDIFGNNPAHGPYNICIASPLFENSDYVGAWDDQNIYTECFSYDDSYDISLIISKRPEEIIPPSVGDMDYSDLVASQFDTVTFATDVAEGAGVRAMAQELRFKAVTDDTPVYGRALGVWTDHYIVSFIITASVLLDEDGTELSDLPEIDKLYDLWLDTLSIYETNDSETKDYELEITNDENSLNPGLLTRGAVRNANRIFDEVRFHSTNGGRGFAAEQANTLFDNIKGIFKGQKAKIIGNDNAKNGADRLLTLKDGTVYQIQTKYYQNGKAGINACFDQETGQFKYMTSKNEPMKIEVPYDQYDDAVLQMKKRISNGDVPGVLDPEQANDIVIKGHVSYEQAKNIAKAGTIDSLKYDAVNGCVDCAFSFGISALVELAVGLWNGADLESAVRQSVLTGLQVGGTTFVISVLSSQLSKSALDGLLVGASDKIVELMGPKVAEKYVEALRNGGHFSSSNIANNASKLVRGQIIVATVSLVVLSIPDIVDTCRGRISGKQLIKNVAETGGGIAGGLGGWFGGAVLGTMILPGVGTVIGGIIGSVAGGFLMQTATGAVADLIVEDDADEMLDIITEEFKVLAEDYLLNEDDIENTMEYLSTYITGNMLKDMFACSCRELYAREIILRPAILKVIDQRQIIITPDYESYEENMITTLKILCDEE